VQRSISKQEVEATLENYHTAYTDKKGNDIRIAQVSGRRIKVVVAKNSKPPLVITVGD